MIRENYNMRHIALLGDSIFDNAAYVPNEPAVINHLRAMLPVGCRASLVANDGDVVSDIAEQLLRLQDDTTHLALSIGGNDALNAQDVLALPAESVFSGLSRLAEMQEKFHLAYREMLWQVLELQKPTVVCTIYDAVPGLSREARSVLSLFNDVICREAMAAGLAIVDLRALLRDKEDYSEISPIEPSAKGGRKIAQALVAGFG